MSAIQETIMYFQKGGLVMWPLLFLSIAVIAISIERFLYFKMTDSGNKFAAAYCAMLANDGLFAAREFAMANQGECARIVAEAGGLQGDKEYHQSFLQTQAGLYMANLRDKLDYLGIIVTMSPLLGLLGTIVGMIGAFSIFNLEAGAPLAITGGIGEALIATATGLCVAILSLCAHSYFTHRMDNIITNMEECFSALLEAETRGAK